MSLVLLLSCWIVPADDTGESVETQPQDSDSGIDTSGGTGVESGALSAFRTWHSATMVNVVNVAWETNLSGRSWVEYGLSPDALDRSTPVVDNGATEHEIMLLGLRSDHTYYLKAVTETEDGQILESEVVSEAIPLQPKGLPVLALQASDPTRTMDGEEGYIMFTILQMDNSWLAIVDREGHYVWYMEADDGLNIPSAHISPERDGIVYTQNDRAQESDNGGIVFTDMAGNKTLTRTVWGHHDANKVPGEDLITYIDVEIQPYDLDGRGEIDIAFDNIRTNPLGASDDSQVERVWSLWYEYSDYPYEPWITCNHFAAEAYNIKDSHDWSHSNSLMTSEDGEYLYMMSKNIDALWKVERSTGTMVWQMGGRDSDFEFSNGDAFFDSYYQWSHAHMSEVPDGRFCLFDNGYHHYENEVGETTGVLDARSRVIEYAYDESSMTMDFVWEFWLPDYEFNAEQGDCKTLDNENHILSVTNSGYLMEVAPNGDVVWHVQVDEVGAGTGRVTYIHDLYALR